MNKINFEQVEAMRKQMLLTVEHIAKFLGVSRETYYNWLKGSYPRKTVEAKVRGRLRILLSLVLDRNWPTPEVCVATPSARYDLLVAMAEGKS